MLKYYFGYIVSCKKILLKLFSPVSFLLFKMQSLGELKSHPWLALYLLDSHDLDVSPGGSLPRLES